MRILLFILLVFQLLHSQAHSQTKTAKGEVMYHVFQRSFYDSNGDFHGDLNGLKSKLDYLQDLGVTSILLTPLYESQYYHNYYSSNFNVIDPSYGTMADYIALVEDIHARGMKIYMDMETQYVTEDHIWYSDSYGNPASVYSDYILYDDEAQLKPSSIVFDIYDLLGYNGVRRKITTVNLLHDKVKDYNRDLFTFWLDPNKDGDFSDGVDGYRLDHMMDDLDNKKRLTNLFTNFWVPLIQDLKRTNPNITIMAEQADWGSYGIDYLEKAAVDWVFAFRIQQAIKTFDKTRIASFADTTFATTPTGKSQLVFIENHDIPRFATVVKQDPDKLKVGAALNLLIGGTPSIYYGQEIGMLGDSFFGKYGGITDANEIPYREAFEWNKDKDATGMAFWYKDSGPWWDTSTVKSDDGISYEEQKNDPNSLWNYYKILIELRNQYPALYKGNYATINTQSEHVYTFSRAYNNQIVIVAINMSATVENIQIGKSYRKIKNIFGGSKMTKRNNTMEATLKPYAVQLWQVSK